ncbi:MAG: energy-coupling factor transporter transmembrane component T [Oscillospiraceae bacterium]
MRDTFAEYHPFVNFFFFTSVLIVTMFMMHPIFLIISMISSVIYSIYLNGKRAFKFNFFMIVPTLLLMALINPTFNHRGITILLYINDNPLTLESIVYGLVTAAMFVSMILWFSCYNSVMTSDKFIYLFGRVIPSLSLMLSMALRFVPRFKAQIKVISNAQKCIGRDVSNGNIIKRAINGLKIISIMTTWCLENAIDTADSMKARGYGISGRTSFSIFRFTKRDKIVLSIMLIAMTYVFIGMILKTVYCHYVPRILLNPTNLNSILIYTFYFIISLMPMGINILEDIKWRYFKSKI